MQRFISAQEESWFMPTADWTFHQEMLSVKNRMITEPLV